MKMGEGLEINSQAVKKKKKLNFNTDLNMISTNLLMSLLRKCWGHKGFCTDHWEIRNINHAGVSSKEEIPVFYPEGWEWVLLTT